MTTVNIRRYSDPDALKEIAPTHLLALMEDHRPYLTTRGITLPPTGREAELDYDHLASMFLCPDDIPPELVEKFHLVKQMSGHDAMDHIIETVKARQLEFTFQPGSSPTDIAAQLLTKAPALFQELHAEKSVERYRSFTFYVGRDAKRSFKPPKDLSALEKELNDWYEQHQRGRTAKIFLRQKDHEYWFYIRHAEPIKREGCVDIKDNHSGSMIYRPERHDLVVYDSKAGEMRVHADCRHEPELFRLLFGKHLFGNLDHFPASREKWTLDPLRAGRKSIACGGIPRLLGVTLKEIEFADPGAHWSRDRIRAEDVFSVFEARKFTLPETSEIRLAKFSIQFSDAKRPRMVTIRPSNYALFGRDDDAVVLQPWLERQGFIARNGESNEERLVA
ncbi:MAG TPA: hypothetical protein PK807_05970 [Verrucomicrobiota bacterium]|jgi:hypothetical protein|nr:hypothetical protein [Verrucomicrobiota bacterium]